MSCNMCYTPFELSANDVCKFTCHCDTALSYIRYTLHVIWSQISTPLQNLQLKITCTSDQNVLKSASVFMILRSKKMS